MKNSLHKGAHRKLFYFASENRKTMTPAEKVLWKCLRNRGLGGFKFRRQHPIADFIADFYCHECNLIIEIDGDYHNEAEQAEYDDGRSFELQELNVRVIRFTNNEVLTNLSFVTSEILKVIKASI